MAEISLCMIVKNEEQYLDACLSSVKGLVDEINIVDTGSTDRTLEIAAKYTDRIFHFDWIDDFAAARNVSFEKATKEYVMWLDADDVIRGGEEFLRLKRELGAPVDVVYMPYYCSFDDSGNVAVLLQRERIVRRERGFRWKGPIHEALAVSGNGVSWDVPVIHTKEDNERSSARNLGILKTIVENENVSVSMYGYYALELKNQGFLQEAEENYLKLFQRAQSGDASFLRFFLGLFELYQESGRWKKALELAEKYEGDYNGFSEFHCKTGDILAELGRIEEAIVSYEKALTCERPVFSAAAISPQHYYFTPHFKLGSLFCKVGELRKSLEHYRKALIERPADKELRMIVSRVQRILELSN